MFLKVILVIIALLTTYIIWDLKRLGVTSKSKDEK